MRNLILLFCLLFALSLSAAQPTIITANVTVTNIAGTVNGNTIQVNGVLRLWTNNVTTGATMIQATNTSALATSNLFRAYAQFPQSSMTIYQPTISNILFKSFIDAAMTVTASAGWATVSYSTNTIGTNAYEVRIPAEAEGIYQRTNIASGLAHWLNISPNTNALDQRAIIASQLMGLANTQTVAGAKSLTNLDNNFYGHFYGLAAGGAPDPGLVWWGTNGNSGLSSAANFLGTVDLCDLRIKANNKTFGYFKTNGLVQLGTNSALTLQPGSNYLNFAASSLVMNATNGNIIADGNGSSAILSGDANQISLASFDSVVIGGTHNIIQNTSPFSTILGGDHCQISYISDAGSIVGGYEAYADHPSVFNWSSYSADGPYHDNGDDTFNVRATGGAYFLATNGFNVTGPMYQDGVVNLATNIPSSWPTAAATPGGTALVNSNSTLYQFISSPGSTVWARTNVVTTGGGSVVADYTATTNVSSFTAGLGLTYIGQVSIPGAQLGDNVSIGFGALSNPLNPYLIWQGYVVTVDQAMIIIYNATGSPQTSIGGNLKVIVRHF